jgi:hypothetical protein
MLGRIWGDRKREGMGYHKVWYRKRMTIVQHSASRSKMSETLTGITRSTPCPVLIQNLHDRPENYSVFWALVREVIPLQRTPCSHVFYQSAA